VKNSYTLTVKVADRSALADLLDAIGPYAQTAEIALANNAPKAAVGPTAMRPRREHGPTPRLRSPKRSRVNDTIRAALMAGKNKIADLKEELIAAGMSAASLSTGIAALTKSKEIERIGDGEYALKAA
jgi:hypothetical protein